MISYSAYRIIHLMGVFMIFLALGGMTLHMINGGTRAHSWRKPVAITHGVGMLLTLVAGFGLLARLGILHRFPGWAIAKMVIWLIFGALMAVVIRKPSCDKAIWWSMIVLGGLAAYLAGYKPF